MNTFSVNLRHIRTNKNLTMKDLSLLCNNIISTGLISDYENNKKKPSLNNLILLSAALNISIDDLVGNKKPD